MRRKYTKKKPQTSCKKTAEHRTKTRKHCSRKVKGAGSIFSKWRHVPKPNNAPSRTDTRNQPSHPPSHSQEKIVHVGVEPHPSKPGRTRMVLQNENSDGALNSKRWECNCSDGSLLKGFTPNPMLKCSCEIRDDGQINTPHGIFAPEWRDTTYVRGNENTDPARYTQHTQMP